LIAAALGLAPLTAQGAPAAGCHKQSFEGEAFTVCRYAPDADDIRLALRGPDGVLGGFSRLARALGPDARRVRFAMNAGMYDPDRTPVGLYVEAGRTRQALNLGDGTGNFYLKPNGVFWVDRDGAAHVDEASAFAAGNAKPLWATQSGPLLVAGGVIHPAVAPNGASLAVRNGVGVKDGSALFAISDRPVSFGRFARFLRDGLACPDALYFDGAVSSLWAPGLGRKDARSNLGPLVVVLARP
jgi:uncharacterized protein YigE (DUF2233 family)